MRALAFTVSFLLAFLLFAVQPMATKMVLPTLGGTPAVWNTAMFTFQVLLLAGYAYAHFLNSRVAPRWQWRMHGLLIAASFLFLPLSVHLVSNEALLNAPILHLAMGFLLQIGLPFFVLSATAPLLQAWVSRSSHPLSKTPYVLYSASNLGSMMGLLGYVTFVEPNLTLPEQSMGWSALFVAGTIALMLAGKMLKPAVAETVAASTKPHNRTILLWVWLSFLPSSLSLGVTSYITTDIAAVPLLWVLPLALYLLSFVDAFRTRPLVVPVAMRLAPLLGMLGLLAYGFQAQRYSQIFVFQLIVFAMLAFCLHGWLARFKPAAQHLTAFYFSMSIGGALGGLLNALVAPMLFNTTLEYPMSLLAASITGFLLWQRGRGVKAGVEAHLFIFSRVMATMIANAVVFYLVFGLVLGDFTLDNVTMNGKTLLMAGSVSALAAMVIYRRYAHIFYATAVLSLLILVLTLGGSQSNPLVFRERSFFGVWKITDQPDENARYLVHNTTVHGAQFLKQEKPLAPLTYYWGLQTVFDHLPVTRSHPYALIGLGSGTVKCFARKNQQVDIFEIDPMVVRIAEDPAMFRYLSDCPGTHEVFLGDGRIRMSQRPDTRYGAIILDAFSSDSIPSHMVTSEAIRMYFDKLVPHGVVLFNTTNRHINLWPLLAGQAQQLGMVAYGKAFSSNKEALHYENYWVAIVRDPGDMAPMMAHEEGWTRLSPIEGTKPWTDDYVNILPYLKMLHPKND